MKKFFLFILLQALVMLCGTARAESTYVTIGNSSSSSSFYVMPYCTDKGNSLTQSIYTASEIGVSGTISKIAYYVSQSTYANNIMGLATDIVEIYMATRTGDTFTSETERLPLSTMTLVYSGNPTLGQSTGWEELTLTTPFEYNGNNLVVAVRKISSTTNSNLRYCYNSTSQKSIYGFSFSSSAGVEQLYYSVWSDRAVTRFQIEQTTFEVGGFKYVVNDKDAKTVSVIANNYSGIVKIPETTEYEGVTYSVTGIGKDAFSGCTSLTYVLLNNGLETIGANAFSGCTSLSSISIPASMTSIADGAFSGCSNLKTVTVDGPVVEKSYTYSSNLKTIFGSQVTKYTIGNNATKIGDYAFDGASNVTSLTMGQNVKEIGQGSFRLCSGLTSLTLPTVLTSIGSSAFQNCSNITEVKIPSSVASIRSFAFSGCESLTKAEFASIESLCSINFTGTQANPLYYAKHLYVDGLEVTDIKIPNSVTRIGSYAFENAQYIKSISIPSSVTSIGESAFWQNNRLEKVDYGSVESLCKINFESASAQPSSEMQIMHLFVNGSEITDLVIPNTVSSIGAYAFYNMQYLKSVHIPSSVTSIGKDAFKYVYGGVKADFESIESLCKISFANEDSNPLSNSNLYVNGIEVKDVVVPNTISSIGDYTFCNATNIESVSIQSSVTDIASSAFEGCSKLATVSIDSPVLVEKTYSSSSDNNLPYLFGSQVTKFIIGDTPTKIGDYTFYQRTGITEVKFGKNIKSIGQRAFYGCTGVTFVVLPEGLTSVGTYAFYGSGMKSLSLPSTLTSIGSYAFGSCSNLNDVYVHYITPPTLSSGFSKYGNLHVYKQMENNYSSQTYWKNFTIVDDIDYQTVTGITFGQPNYTIEVGDLGELTCSVSPSNALLKDVKWSTDDTDIIFVDENTGQFVGLSDGVATVTATSVDYNGFSATVQIYVGNTEREDAIALSQSAIDLRINNSYTLTATQVTNTGSDKPVTWTSSNTSVATVSNGVVTGVGEGNATITASIAGGKSATCLVNVYMLKAVIADGSLSTYTNSTTEIYDQIIYARNYSNTKWQSLYVPFTMKYEDWKDEYDVAYINSVRQYDDDNDGTIDRTIMDVLQITSGELYPNMPYLIKAKTTGEKTITLQNATLYATEENSIECSTMLSTFTFTGTYSTIPASTLKENGYYAMGGGGLIMTNGTSNLKPFRWYMGITSRSPMYNTATDNPSRISVHVIGEEDDMETSLYGVAREEELDDQIFNLNGQMIDASEPLAPGLYIKNGKKVIIR